MSEGRSRDTPAMGDDSGASPTSEVLLRFEDPTGQFAVVLQDDGRTGYAYFLRNERITGDVWLYNVGPPPAKDAWKDPSAMPFQNPASYCRDEVVPRINEGSIV